MIILLNDNEMSISPNVGALSGYLNRIQGRGHTTSLSTKSKSGSKLSRLSGVDAVEREGC